MGLISEFKQFALKGNAVQLAIGVVIGAAFGKIVSSLVNDIIMPPIGLLIGGIDFSRLKVVIHHAHTTKAGKFIPETSINYGAFVNNVVDFVIVATAIFMVIKVMNAAMRKPLTDQPPAPLTKEEQLLTDIRDLLKEQPRT